MGTAQAEEINWMDQLSTDNIPADAPSLKADTSDLAEAESTMSWAQGQNIKEGNYVSKKGIAIGSLPHDWLYTVKAYSKALFPNMPEEQSMGRFGMKDGRVYYLGLDDQLYWATPDFSAVKEDISNIDEWASKAVGPAIPIGAGTVAGVTTMNPIIAGAAGATGEGVRQALAHELTGEKMSIPKRAINIGTAGLIETGGQLGGNLLNKAIAKVLQKLPAKIKGYPIGDKFAKFNTTIKDNLLKISQKHNVKLTPAEITADRQLIRLQKVLANTSNADEIMEAFYKMRNGEAKEALYKVFMNIADAEAPEIAFKEAIKGAKGIIEGEKRILYDQAQAYYQKAFTVNNVNVRPTLDVIDTLLKTAKGNTYSKLLSVKSMLFKKTGQKVSGAGGKQIDEVVPETSLKALDNVKKQIDSIINTAERGETSIAKTDKAVFTQIKEALLQQTDAVSKEYATARGIYEAGMPNVTSIEKSILGSLSKQNTEQFYDVGKLLFSANRSSVKDVALAREMFNKAGLTNEWNQIVRSHLERNFNAVLKEESVGNIYNLAGKFYNKIWGNKTQRNIMKEALKSTDDFGENFVELMTLFSATQKAMKENSATAFYQQAIKELSADSKPALAKMIETLEIWNQPKRISSWWTDVAFNKSAVRMAELLTTPNGLKEISKLRELGKNSKAIVVAFTHLMAGGSLYNYKESAEGDKDLGSYAVDQTMPNKTKNDGGLLESLTY